MRVFINQVWPTVIWIVMAGHANALQQQVPVVTIGSVRQEVNYGNYVTLTCSVTSVGILKKVYWQKMFNASRRNIHSATAGVSGITLLNPSMTILKATTFDSGTYQCVAENSVGTGYSLSTNLIVKGGLPVVSIGSASYTTVYGKTITIICSINANPAATGVYWIKVTNGNITVINTGAVGTKGITTGSPSLQISYPSYKDSGEYTCYATNDMGTGSSGVAVLTVTGEIPIVSIGLRNYVTDYGTSIVLYCTVATTTIPFDVYWNKEVSGNVTRITSSTTGITGVTKDNPSLTIKFATTSDTGIYTCFAANYIGTGSSKPTTLTVNGGLPKVSAPRDSYNTNEGKPVSLGCLITAQPPVKNVYWVKQKGDQVLVINNGGVGVVGVTAINPALTIQYPVREDSGIYTCHAINIVGSSSSQFIYLTVSLNVKLDTDESCKDDSLTKIGVPLIAAIVSAIVSAIITGAVACYVAKYQMEEKIKANQEKNKKTGDSSNKGSTQ